MLLTGDTNMKIYVASHCRWAALYVAKVLSENGLEITSRWHEGPFYPTDRYTFLERQRIAAEDIEDVTRADVLVLVAGPDKYSGGKFIEAGIAMGQNKQVFVLGRRENMLLWSEKVVSVNALPQLLRALLQQGCHE